MRTLYMGTRSSPHDLPSLRPRFLCPPCGGSVVCSRVETTATLNQLCPQKTSVTSQLARTRDPGCPRTHRRYYYTYRDSDWDKAFRETSLLSTLDFGNRLCLFALFSGKSSTRFFAHLSRYAVSRAFVCNWRRNISTLYHIRLYRLFPRLFKVTFVTAFSIFQV